MILDKRQQERKQGTSQSGLMTGHHLFLTMEWIVILKATCKNYKCSWRELNAYLMVRSHPVYPLSYRNRWVWQESKNYALHSCVSRVKSPVHSRFATYPDVSYRTRTCIGGLEVPCPFHWTNETQRPSDLNRYSRIQSPACSPLH